MASKKDMRRLDLFVPYIEPAAAKDGNDGVQSTMASTLPMAAIFTKNKFIGLAAVTVAVQNWLSESPDSKAEGSTPAILGVGFAFLALAMSYMPLFMPPGKNAPAGTTTGAAPAASPI